MSNQQCSRAHSIFTFSVQLSSSTFCQWLTATHSILERRARNLRSLCDSSWASYNDMAFPIIIFRSNSNLRSANICRTNVAETEHHHGPQTIPLELFLNRLKLKRIVLFQDNNEKQRKEGATNIVKRKGKVRYLVLERRLWNIAIYIYHVLGFSLKISRYYLYHITVITLSPNW